MIKKSILFFLLTGMLFLLNNCSINKMVSNGMADKLAGGGGTVFTGDDDPELIRDAIPFALKLYETLLVDVPDNTGLLVATGKAYSMYAFAFVQLDAERLLDEDIDKKTEMVQRAKKLFLRGRKYCLQAIEIKYPDFKKEMEKGQIDKVLNKMTKDDIDAIYWAGLSWMGAFSLDPFDMELSLSKNKAVSMLNRVLQLDEKYDQGGIHNFFISYYGAMPPDLGGSEEKARAHFKRAVEISKGRSASPYYNLATTISVKNQNVKEYKELLEQVLAIDVDKEPGMRLSNVLMQKQSKWLLDHIDKFFILDEGEAK